MFWWEHVNTRKHVSEHSRLSGWVILSILAHLAHLAQSFFSLIFSAINTYNCSWFDLTSKKICSHWKRKLGEKWPMVATFFPHGHSRHYWLTCFLPFNFSGFYLFIPCLEFAWWRFILWWSKYTRNDRISTFTTTFNSNDLHSQVQELKRF